MNQLDWAFRRSSKSAMRWDSPSYSSSGNFADFWTDQPESGRVSGNTLVEILITAVIATVVLGAVGTAMTTLQAALTERSVSASAEDVTRRTLDRILSELRDAQAGSIVLGQPEDARSMTYSTIDGWDAFGVIVSPPKTLSFESGRILLDGEVIAADDIGDLTFNFDNNLLTTAIEVEKTFKARGQTQTVVSRHVAQLRL